MSSGGRLGAAPAGQSVPRRRPRRRQTRRAHTNMAHRASGRRAGPGVGGPAGLLVLVLVLLVRALDALGTQTGAADTKVGYMLVQADRRCMPIAQTVNTITYIHPLQI